MLNIKSIFLSVLLASTATSTRLGEPNDETRRLVARPIKLGSAGIYTVLTKAGVTTTDCYIHGYVGVGERGGTMRGITGFRETMDRTNQFSTSPFVDGRIYAASYNRPTPSKMTTAIDDMDTAFTDAAKRYSPDYTDLGGGNIEGMTLEPGLYKWRSDVEFTSSLTFVGSSTDIWILQIDMNLLVGLGAFTTRALAGKGARVTLSGGAVWENIYWQVSGAAIFGRTSHVEGVFLVQRSITFNTGSSLNGNVYAQNAVTLHDDVTIIN